MANTLIEAVQERYDTVAAPWPEFWSGMAPENTALNFPNHVLEHLGEETTYEANGAGRLIEAYTKGWVQMTFWAATIREADGLARRLHAVMKSSPLTIGSDTYVEAKRGKYRVMKAQHPYAPSGSYAFAAMTPYEFMFNVD